LTINERAVTDQKIAVGAVENPACWRLREFAKAVPADLAIVELGAYRGRTAGWLALGASEGAGARVYSVDPWDDKPADSWPEGYADRRVKDEYGSTDTRLAYLAHLDECGISELVTPIQGFGHEIGKTWDGPKVGLLWHDAEHHAEAVTRDLRAWLPHMADDSVIVLHDAGDPRFGVNQGAKAALSRLKAWDWAGRELQLWPKQPDKRGILIVRKR
jgi:hypothetical protein